MDQAQITSALRHFLTSLGTAMAGTGVAGWFSDSNINIAVMIVGIVVGLFGAIWGNRSSTPVALAQKLVSNPAIPNAVAANAIATGEPEKLAR